GIKFKIGLTITVAVILVAIRLVVVLLAVLPLILIAILLRVLIVLLGRLFFWLLGFRSFIFFISLLFLCVLWVGRLLRLFFFSVFFSLRFLLNSWSLLSVFRFLFFGPGLFYC